MPQGSTGSLRQPRHPAPWPARGAGVPGARPPADAARSGRRVRRRVHCRVEPACREHRGSSGGPAARATRRRAATGQSGRCHRRRPPGTRPAGETRRAGQAEGGAPGAAGHGPAGSSGAASEPCRGLSRQGRRAASGPLGRRRSRRAGRRPRPHRSGHRASTQRRRRPARGRTGRRSPRHATRRRPWRSSRKGHPHLRRPCSVHQFDQRGDRGEYLPPALLRPAPIASMLAPPNGGRTCGPHDAACRHSACYGQPPPGARARPNGRCG